MRFEALQKVLKNLDRLDVQFTVQASGDVIIIYPDCVEASLLKVAVKDIDLASLVSNYSGYEIRI